MKQFLKIWVVLLCLLALEGEMALGCDWGVTGQMPSSSPAPKPANQTVNAILGDTSFYACFGVWPDADTDETLRIKTHLAYVERLLRRKTPPELSATQRIQRQINLDRLHQYRLRGTFPRSFSFSANRKPCFIDWEGRLCAVGYLVAESAGLELAKSVNDRYQYALLADMHLPELDQWVHQSGFTPLELGMIQPQYFEPILPKTPLNKAVRSKDLGKVRDLLAAGAKVNQGDPGNGYTPLYWAVEPGNLKLMKVLLEAGAKVDQPTTTTGMTPLMLAVWLGEIDIVKLLLAAGANVNQKDHAHQTPLFHAITTHNPEVRTQLIKLLVQARARIQVTSRDGSTPLHVAMSFGSPEDVQILLKAGARVNIQDTYGNTPLMEGMYGGRNLETVKLLLAAGAKVGFTSRDGETAFSILIQNLRSPDALPLVEFLLQAGAEVNDLNHFGQTPLMYLAEHRHPGHLEIVKKLLSAGADVNLSGPEGKTALMYAADGTLSFPGDRLELVKVLLAAGAKADVLDRAGWEKLLQTRHPYTLKSDQEWLEAEEISDAEREKEREGPVRVLTEGPLKITKSEKENFRKQIQAEKEEEEHILQLLLAARLETRKP
ncbi:MAG: ankyrin repeat domain-containing protein [Blastocatellia bacterium]|nr:ankyrin repeat domain-containing protein [Blastocatellia bacterium]